MPWRIIKDSIKHSKTICSLNWFEEVCFIHLLVTVDDFGRYYRDPMILKNELFPRKDDLTVKDIDDALIALERESLIKSYCVAGENYLQIVTWSKHQRTRAAKSKFPDPDDFENGCPTDDGRLSDKRRTDARQTTDIREQMLPNKKKNKKKMNENDGSAPFISDSDAEQINQDHTDVIDRLKYCGFEINPAKINDALELYAEHGRDKLLSAIGQCSEATGNKWAYLRKVLENWGNDKPRVDVEYETFNWV